MSDTDPLHKTSSSRGGRMNAHGMRKIVASPLQPRINVKKLFLRLVSGILMMLILTMLVLLGPLTLIIAIAGIQLAVFKEVVSIAYSRSKEKKLPWFRTTMW
jgi:cytidylyltransferase family protein